WGLGSGLHRHILHKLHRGRASDVEFARVVLRKMTQVGGSDWAGKISARAHNEKRISLENSLWAADSCVVINPCPLRTSRALLAPITC
ncbi:unnamed protein product, partial [Musa textilis]